MQDNKNVNDSLFQTASDGDEAMPFISIVNINMEDAKLCRE